LHQTYYFQVSDGLDTAPGSHSTLLDHQSRFERKEHVLI
jgi:hypothetical protein